MVEKKVICNSGGIFHKAEDGSLSYSGGNAQATCIHNGITFDEFEIELRELFEHSIGTMCIKYFIPGYSKTLITISNDKGLRRMIQFHGDSDVIELYLTNDEILPLDVSNMQQCIRSSRTTLPEAMAPADASLNIVDNEVDDTNATLELIAPVSGLGDTNNVESHIKVSPMMPRGDPNDAKLWKNSITGVGQTFNNVDELRESLRKYAFAHQFALRFKKNDSNRVIVKCKTEGCPWGIHALRSPESAELFRINKMNSEHNCDKAATTTGHQASSLVAGLIEEKLKVSPNYYNKIEDIVSDFKQEYGIQITYLQAWRAKKKADGRAKMIADGIEITNQPARRAKKKADGMYQPAQHAKKHRRLPLLDEMITEEEEHRRQPLLGEMTIEEEELRQQPLLGEMTIEENITPMMPPGDCRSPLLVEMTIQEEEHRQSPRLCEMIIEENPGGLATFTTKDDSTFPGRFFAFRASLSGFQQGCRPLLFLDSILLHSNFLLFTASTVDGDDNDLPIAFAVVDRETENNWHWFLLLLKACLPISCLSISCPITFVADRHYGLKELISNVFPGSFHAFSGFYLLFYLLKEFKKLISSDVKYQIVRYWEDAFRSPSFKGYHESLERIKGISSEVYDWISKISPTNLSNAFSPGKKI